MASLASWRFKTPLLSWRFQTPNPKGGCRAENKVGCRILSPCAARTCESIFHFSGSVTLIYEGQETGMRREP